MNHERHENKGKGLMSKLWFSEFRNAGEWRETRLGELGELTGVGTSTKSNDSFWKGSVPWVFSSGISEDSIYELMISWFITKEATKILDKELVPEGSILLVYRLVVGKLAITKTVVFTSQNLTNLIPCNDDLEFLSLLLKENSYALACLGQSVAITGFMKGGISKPLVFSRFLRKNHRMLIVPRCINHRAHGKTLYFKGPKKRTDAAEFPGLEVAHD